MATVAAGADTLTPMGVGDPTSGGQASSEQFVAMLNLSERFSGGSPYRQMVWQGLTGPRAPIAPARIRRSPAAAACPARQAEAVSWKRVLVRSDGKAPGACPISGRAAPERGSAPGFSRYE